MHFAVVFKLSLLTMGYCMSTAKTIPVARLNNRTRAVVTPHGM